MARTNDLLILNGWMGGIGNRIFGVSYTDEYREVL